MDQRTTQNIGNESNDQVDLHEEQQLPTRCSICYTEPPINSIKLDCGHVFCFLCIKSTAELTGCCAICRAEIGIEFNFMEHKILGVARVPTSSDGYYWFYEGYKGWWLYDAETNRELESAFQKSEKSITKFIAGSIYSLSIENMVQQRVDGEGRSRRMCRKTLDLENIIGMSGIKGEDFDDILETMKYADKNPM